jgi:AcrR family transcriptional regulator
MLGRKGNNTRIKIIDATEQLLEESRGLPPSITAISRMAKISPATFYLYFVDVAEAIHAAVERVTTGLDPIFEVLEDEWPADQTFDCARRFIEAFFEYWRQHSAVLRARNRIADEGNPVFIKSRVMSADRLIDGLTARVAPAVLNGKEIATSRDIAGVLFTAMERTVTTAVLDLYPELTQDWDASINTLAYELMLNFRK